eukprot:TRINITY_DN1413_c0_g1_i1.p1 TRINITY_DN1413_c0_g1~~TRINITY_DN1413_c0_g1_i1.p1  ORF type:complete len:111 (+),score=8.90 TRINITY_DN1413_c0_g1_i1:306-638(+)
MKLDLANFFGQHQWRYNKATRTHFLEKSRIANELRHKMISDNSISHRPPRPPEARESQHHPTPTSVQYHPSSVIPEPPQWHDRGRRVSADPLNQSTARWWPGSRSEGVKE